MKISLVLALLFTCAPLNHASGFDFGSADERAFYRNADLKFKEFFEYYISKSPEERRASELYLLGVIDLSEGTDWCSYSKFKTITIAEILFPNMRNRYVSGFDDRSAFVIKKILKTNFPC